MKTNYHTHTYLCGHAKGAPVDYAEEAYRCGMAELGMTDHLPFPENHLPDRMMYEQLPLYCEEVEKAKAEYAGKVKIYRGLEAEYFPAKDKYYEKLLADKTVEFLILGQHYFAREDGSLVWMFADLKTSEDVIEYARVAMNAMTTGYFTFLAHPDLFTMGKFPFDVNTDRACDMIINEAVKHDYILEMNANGMRRDRPTYPSPYFWEKVSGTGIRVVICSDAHRPELLDDEAIQNCRKMAAELKLNVVDQITL